MLSVWGDGDPVHGPGAASTAIADVGNLAGDASPGVSGRVVGEPQRELLDDRLMADEEQGRHVAGRLRDDGQEVVDAGPVEAVVVVDRRVRTVELSRREVPRLAGAPGAGADDEIGYAAGVAQPDPRLRRVPAARVGRAAARGRARPPATPSWRGAAGRAVSASRPAVVSGV